MSLDKLFPISVLLEGDDGAGNGGNDGGDTWYSGLPEEVQSWDEVKNSDSPEKFWGQMTNMRSLIGRSIQIPSKNSGPEDINAFHEKLIKNVPGLIPAPNYEDENSVNTFYNAVGRPESADGYTIPDIDNKGVELDNSPIDSFKPIAHKHGLSQKQFDGIVADMTAMNVEAAVKSSAEAAEAKTQLKNMWGLAYENNMQKIAVAAKHTGAPDALVEAVKIGNVDAETAQWLLNLSNSLSSESFNFDEKGGGALTPAEAQKEISAIMNNKEHDYWKPSSPGHQAAKDYMTQLYEMTEPGSGTNLGSGDGGSVGIGGVTFK